MLKTTLIIATYNWPEALKCVLETVLCQSRMPDEVIIADDGSTPETQQCIAAFQQKLPIQHVWQPDQGFRKSMILNKAVAAAQGEYLIFLDGDCIPQKDFIQNHVALASDGYFVSGHRAMLTPAQTQNYLQTQSVTLSAKQQFKLTPKSLGYLRKLTVSQWHNVKGCNLALFKADYLAVNGYDECFEGWGYEDSDFIIRLGKIGVKRLSGKYAVTVMHLEHQHGETDLGHHPRS